MSRYAELLQAMQDKYTELSGRQVEADSDTGLRFRVLAGELYSLLENIQWLQNAMQPQTATGEQLDKLAQEWGKQRLEAACAEGQLRFYSGKKETAAVAVLKGTVVETAGEPPQQFQTTQLAFIPAGEPTHVDVPAVALQAGPAGNAQPDTITVPVTWMPRVARVTNPQAFRGGRDRENDEALRSRLLHRAAAVDNGSNAAYYRAEALKQPGVRSAGIVPRENGAGTVGVYLAGESGPADADTVAAVQAALDKARELNVEVTVQAAQEQALDLTLAVRAAEGTEAQDTRQRCVYAVQACMAGLEVGQALTEAQLIATVYGTGLVTEVRLTAPASLPAVTSGQLLVPGTITITLGTGT